MGKNYIDRPIYMDWLQRWRNRGVIKVVSGVRRCGKSTLLEMFRNQLQKEDVKQNRIISINFEDIAYEALSTYRELHQYLADRIQPSGTTYIFLDEIQKVDHFEKALDSLSIRDDCDIYITGSNAYIMASELATLLTGRYVELKMLPLSFSEFAQGATGQATTSKEELFSIYLQRGSLPYVAELLDDPKTAREYIQDVYASILLKDVVGRLHVADVSTLERIAKVLASNVGSLISTNKIANTLRSQGNTTDQKTVDKYLDGLVNGLLFYEAPRWNIKGRHLLSRNSKFYIVDTGLRATLVASTANDTGHLLENIIFLELKRRGKDVYVGALDDGEIDFVARDGQALSYYQVAASVLDATTLERELAPFRKVEDNYPKTLLTLDRIIPQSDIDGVRIINALDWLESE